MQEKNLINPHTGKRDPDYTAKEKAYIGEIHLLGATLVWMSSLARSKR